MALETASYISQLVPANPLSTDLLSQTDDHLRLLKACLVNSFPGINAPVTATADQLNNPVPKGAIILWSGLATAIPQGYGLCDGTQGTPDLRNRFVIGAGSTYSPLATGGDVSTGMAGAHSHTVNQGTESLVVSSLAVAAGVDSTVTSGVTANGHTHTINQVGDHQHSALPPFLSLCYIQKL
jgi:hypothetical protein